MTDEHIDVEVIKAHDPNTGQTVEAVIVPAGYVLCLVKPETVEKYSDWTEAVAVRIKRHGDTVAALEVTADLDWVTGPEADDAA